MFGCSNENDSVVCLIYKDEDPVVFLSKKLSFILRHGAEKMGFKLMPGIKVLVK